MASSSSPPNSSIPTLSLLYKLKKLAPASQSSLAPNATPAHNSRIGLIRGDITTLPVDAIVNAANRSLLGGGGVDGAIHRAAGPGLYAECRKLGGCATGSAKITNAYDLPCKKVIHAVGPIYDEDDAKECEKELEGCYSTSLKLAAENGLRTIAFSGISTGVYGYPSADAAVVACRTVRKFLDGEEGKKLDMVVFVTFEMKDVRSYNEVLPRFFPPETTKEQQQEADEQTAEAEAMASKLPDVPKTDPADPQHAFKKQKHESDN